MEVFSSAQNKWLVFCDLLPDEQSLQLVHRGVRQLGPDLLRALVAQGEDEVLGRGVLLNVISARSFPALCEKDAKLDFTCCCLFTIKWTTKAEICGKIFDAFRSRFPLLLIQLE